ncbi:MAG: hypothetical protein Q7U42_03250, partial [Parvibaculum sp.]|nr:hypothetical protein [Parvibaculum sp.]
MSGGKKERNGGADHVAIGKLALDSGERKIGKDEYKFHMRPLAETKPCFRQTCRQGLCAGGDGGVADPCLAREVEHARNRIVDRLGKAGGLLGFATDKRGELLMR